jgi:hypothetical protein
MSIKTDATTTVTLDTTELQTSPSTEIVLSGEHCVNIPPLNEITATRKEYSIVGDSFYAGINSSVAPTWLTDLIDSVVSDHVASGLTDYNLLVQDVRNAIDALDVAKNTFEDNIAFQIRVDGVIGTRITTLNASFENVQSQITDLDLVVANNDEAIALRVTDLNADLTEDINSRITIVNSTVAALDQATADSITSLTTAFTDQESNLTGTANAVTGLQTYVGIDEESLNPNGLGMLSRLSTLEKQGDGAVIITSNTYDVMEGVTDPDTSVDDNKLRVDALPYVLWTNLEGSGLPVATTRPYMNYELETPVENQISISEGTLYVREDSTDVDLDTYYRFSSGSWTVITEIDYIDVKYSARNNSIGDVYIHYDSVDGTRNYLRSYKFIKTAVDNTSPFATDDGGYGWALVADTDSQAIYMLALQARDMADGKISHFYAWGDGAGGIEPTTYVVTLSEAEYDTDVDGNYLDINGDITEIPANYVEINPAITETVVADSVALWFTGGNLYRQGSNWIDKIAIPTTAGNGLFISTGDMLTVFDPINNDTTVYWFNGTSWQVNGPEGIISKSKWFVDLDNAVNNKHGHLALSLNDLSITGKTYADEKTLAVENKFAYNSTIFLADKFYSSGFGLDSTGITQTTDGLTEETAFDSEFWVNAKRFVLKNPDDPTMSASFSVTGSGIKLSLENTEATKNVAAGTHNSTLPYDSGDIVSSNNKSYIAKIDVPADVILTNTTYWQLLVESGDGGSYVDFLFIRSVLPPDLPPGETWFSNVVDTPSGDGDLWSVKTTVTEGTLVYSDKRIIESEVVREILIYSYSTPNSVTAPTGSTYNFSTASLTVNDTNWSQGIPSVLTNNHKIWVCVGLVEGNRTEVAKPVNWSLPNVYAQRVDGTDGGEGDVGIKGDRGTAVLTYSAEIPHALPSSVSEASLNSYWNSKASAALLERVVGDTLVVTNTTAVIGWTHIYEYTLTGWDASNTFVVSGNQVVEGTISSEALVTGIIIGTDAFFEGELTAASGTFVGDITGANGTFAGQLAANSAVINTSEVATNSAPFIVKHRNGYQSNERIDRSITTPELYSPSYSVGFYNYRLSHTVMDIEFEIFSVLDSGKQSRGNTNVKVSYDGAPFTAAQIATVIHVDSNHTGTLPIFVSYTTKSEAWNTVQFQVSVYGSPGVDYEDEFRSLGLFYTMEVLNHAESANTPESVRTFGSAVTPPSYPGIGCFIAGSLVTMSDGTVKIIEDIKVGENLLGYEGSYNKVLQLWQHAIHERIIFNVNNGLLETTSAHPILTTEGWKAFDPKKSMQQHPGMVITLLNNGDTLVKMSVTGEILEEIVTSISSTLCKVPVYNFDVSGNNTYIVNDVVVHNK